MAGWTAMVCGHMYRVPDELCARELVDALADFGFCLVSAAPCQPSPYLLDDGAGGEWRVHAVDARPYALTEQGSAERDAVDAAARLIAREHQGYWDGGTQCDVSQLDMLLSRPAAGGVVERRTPGARPQVPPLPPAAPPLPAAALVLDDDAPLSADIDLSDLHDVPWNSLTHAHGPADDVPGLIEAMAHGFGEWRELHGELIGDDVLHQGTCYPATSHVMRFLARMITSGILPAAERSDVYMDLVYGATRYGGSLLGDAERAAARGREPSPAPCTEEVRDAVAAEVPGLLTRWASEPPRLRLLLAVLAALFPESGRVVLDQVAAMGRNHAGTDAGALLDLAVALIAQDERRAETAARALASGAPALGARRRSRDLGAPGLPVAVRAAGLLFDAATRVGEPQRQA